MVQARRIRGLSDEPEPLAAAPCAVCGELTAARLGVCSRNLGCSRVAMRRYAGLSDDVPPDKFCDLCGGPLGARNATGACSATPECKLEATRRRRAASTRRRLSPPARAALAQELAVTQGGQCTWCCCALDAADLVLDHVIPVSRGGPEDLWNRQVLHWGCNSEKGAQLTAPARELAAEHGIPLPEDDGCEPRGVAYRIGVLTRDEILARFSAA